MALPHFYEPPRMVGWVQMGEGPVTQAWIKVNGEVVTFYPKNKEGGDSMTKTWDLSGAKITREGRTVYAEALGKKSIFSRTDSRRIVLGKFSNEDKAKGAAAMIRLMAKHSERYDAVVEAINGA